MEQTSDENKQKYQLGDYCLIQYLNINIKISTISKSPQSKIVGHAVRRITNEILGVKGLRPIPSNVRLLPSIQSSLKRNQQTGQLLFGNDNQVVKSSGKLAILGVSIDEKSTVSEHMKDISRKASPKVGVLLRLYKLILCSAILQLYKFAIFFLI